MDLLEEGISTTNDQATDIKRAESFKCLPTTCDHFRLGK